MDETSEIRRAGSADAEAIHALVHEAYAKWIPLIGRLPTPMRTDYAQAVRQHRFDLLEIGGDLAALIETAPEPGHLMVVNVAVRPTFQGRGHGVRLLNHAEGLAAAGGLATLRLYTNKKYTANLRLYASLGYRVEREEPYAGADRTLADDTVVHMAKDVAHGAAVR